MDAAVNAEFESARRALDACEFDPRDRLRVMCSTLRRVILENFNYCNRKCSFCPNSRFDRRSSKVFLPQEVFTSLLKELASGEYAGALLFGRYHEPLADSVVFDRVARARHLLPACHIGLNANGDFANADVLRRLDQAGLSEIKIMQYLPEGCRFSAPEAVRYCERTIARLGVSAELHDTPNDLAVSYTLTVPGVRMRVSLHSENYSAPGYGSDRGGVLLQWSQLPRAAACWAPCFEINVDYDGSVMPCCNLVSNVPGHRPFILGNVGKHSLVDIFFDRAAMNFRRSVRTAMRPEPCRNCQYYWPNRLSPDEQRLLTDTGENCTERERPRNTRFKRSPNIRSRVAKCGALPVDG